MSDFAVTMSPYDDLVGLVGALCCELSSAELELQKLRKSTSNSRLHYAASPIHWPIYQKWHK